VKVLETIIPFLYRSLRVEKTEFYRQYSLTPTQIEVIGALRVKSMTLSALSEAVMLDSSTLVGIIDRLENQALVKKKISSRDRRKNIISLTEKGIGLILSIPAFSSATLQFLINELEPGQREAFITTLAQLAEKLGITGIIKDPAPSQEISEPVSVY
jgi:DNA-binding MarR family transcriptional regulator